jgi:chlorophyll synthase
MGRATASAVTAERPAWTAYIELLKPITWFPPMWAFGCGVVSSGQALPERWPFALAGILLAGPLVSGASQIVNDWFDREVDAINEPGRPVPSGRVPGRNALYFAILWSALSLWVGAMLGIWVFAATIVGVALAWAYSAPPFRLKLNGWWGNAAVGLCYEGLPWFTAAAAIVGGLPATEVILLALLYSAGAHGIMTLNDFKAIEGDQQLGVRSLPVQLGARRAAQVACAVMLLPQLVVIALLIHWNLPISAAVVGGLVLAQAAMMVRFLAKPVERALWLSALGVTLYVLGMLASAIGVRGLVIT